MITVVPRLPGQSSSNPVAPRTCTKQPSGSHAGMCGSKADWYGEGETGRFWTWKLAYCFLSPLHLVGQLDIYGFHGRFTNVSVHQIRMQTAPAALSPEASRLTSSPICLKVV